MQGSALYDDVSTSTLAPATQERIALRRALGLGLIVWPAFFALDVYMALVVVPGAPLALFLVYRLLFELFLIALWRLGRDPDLAIGQLRTMIRLMAVGAGLVITLMAIPLGGLTSPYVHGLSVVTLVMAVVIPTPWRLALTWLVPTTLTFPVVMAATAIARGSDRVGWRSGRDLAMFAANYAFVVAIAAVGAIAGHLVSQARRQVYEARRLGRYRLVAPLGRGAMNEVWLARDVTLRRDVALKILRAENAEKQRALEGFLGEARTLSRLTSPHTVRIFDFGGSDDGLYFIAMERLVGADLLEVVSQGGRCPPARAAHIVRQVCRSLYEAHEAGLVHRDVKPANIFLTQAGDELDFVKIVDFGLARIFTHGIDVSHTMVFAGTPRYMAPELWWGHAATPSTDLYALGATFYFLLTGTELFGHLQTLQEISRAQMNDVPPRPSASVPGEIPAELDEIVGRCLAKTPEARYASANDLLASLLACRARSPWTPEDATRAWSTPGARPSLFDTGVLRPQATRVREG